MKLLLASIAPRPGAGPAQQLLGEYLRRTQPFFPAEATVFRSEAALLAALERGRARTAPALVLLDRQGTPLSSEGLAALLERYRDAGMQQLVFAVGPADGWSAAMRSEARETVSLGAMTLPHELARLVLAEQIYRAATILAGHPYHCGH